MRRGTVSRTGTSYGRHNVEKSNPSEGPKSRTGGKSPRPRGATAESGGTPAKMPQSRPPPLPPQTVADLSQLTNDELDVRAAHRLAGGVACQTAAEIGQGFVDQRVVTYAGDKGQPPSAHTADGRWSPTRDPTLAAQLEEEILRQRRQEAYVDALARLLGPPPNGHPALGDPAVLFSLIHASPRFRTIAALMASRVPA
jgi:hypothetical protein